MMMHKVSWAVRSESRHANGFHLWKRLYAALETNLGFGGGNVDAVVKL